MLSFKLFVKRSGKVQDKLLNEYKLNINIKKAEIMCMNKARKTSSRRKENQATIILERFTKLLRKNKNNKII